MIGKAFAIAAALLVSIQAYAQTNQSGTGAAQGVTSGPAAGSPATMRSPQAGPLATKHQRQVLRRHPGSQSGYNSHQAAGQQNGAAEASGSSSPPSQR
jgi:hypothetical protein